MSKLAAFVDMAFGFKGRLRRRDYWWVTILFVLVLMAVSEIVIINLFGAEYGLIAGSNDTAAKFSTPLSVLLVDFVLMLPLTWSCFAITAKRFQDQDKSPKWGLIAWAIATVPSLLMPFLALLWNGDPKQWSDGESLISLLTLPALLYAFVVAGFFDGTPGPNRYGPSPKGLEFAKVS